MWLREHGRVYSAGSPVDTGEIALYKNYSLFISSPSFRIYKDNGHSLFISSSPLTLFFSLPWTFFLRLFGHYFFFFLDLISLSLSLSLSLSGDRFLFSYFPQFVSLHPTVTTGLISGHACLGVPAIKSAAPMSPHPRVNLLVPVPAATYNTCSAHN